MALRASQATRVTLVIVLWTGVNPLLRLAIYPLWSLKQFIQMVEVVSIGILLLEILTLFYAARKLTPDYRPAWSCKRLSLLSAFCLYPVLWLSITLILWVLTEFSLLSDSAAEPLYSSDLFVQEHPWSFTGLSFILSAVLEEAFYRSWLPFVLRKYLRPSLAIGLSCLLFSLAHLSLQASSLALVSVFLVALALSYISLRFGLGAAMLVHGLNNLVVLSSKIFHVALFPSLMGSKLGMWCFFSLSGLGALLMIKDLCYQGTRGPSAPLENHSLP